MKKRMIKIVAGLLSLSSMFFASLPQPVFADGAVCTCEGGGNGTTVDAAILKDVCDCGHGESVIAILNLVVNIMTVGIGILGVVGITIVGIQYLTAGGNEEKTRKAKRRMLEIVIGLMAYVLIYALVKWLMPHFGG